MLRFMKRCQWRTTTELWAGVLLLACGSQPSLGPTAAATAPPASPSPRQPQAEAWDGFVQQLLQGLFERAPSFAVQQGRHEFDGLLPDLTAAGLAEKAAYIQAQRLRAESFDPASLDPRRRVERAHVIAECDSELFWALKARLPQRSPMFYSNLIDPSVYLTRSYAPLPTRMAAYNRLVAQIPGVVHAMKENLELPLPKTYVELGANVFGGMASYLRDDVPPLFAGVEDSALHAEFAAVTSAAVEALLQAEQWYSLQRESATGAFALGKAAFQEMLWATERVDVPLEELQRVGQADLERNLASLKTACARVAPGQPVRACIATVQNKKPVGGPVAGARKQLSELREFLVARKFVTIPGPEKALVDEAPPYRRWNTAYIEIPGPFENNLPSTYYIAPPDPSWSEEDRNAYIPSDADLLFISVHEVWPGHFLQFLHANRVARPFSRNFVGYAFSEGWAHYAEEAMWEAGLAEGDPEVHVGQLLNALLRNVRFLSAIGLHTQGMTVAESEALFTGKAYQDAGNARQQAARGTFDPAYLNYTLGKLMIRKMRADWLEQQGDSAGWQPFHDALLSFGGPPLPEVRRALLGSSGSIL